MNNRFDLISEDSDLATKRFNQVLLEIKAGIKLETNLEEVKDCIVVADYTIEKCVKANQPYPAITKLKEALFFLVYNIKEK